jgi:hypothetical protein
MRLSVRKTFAMAIVAGSASSVLGQSVIVPNASAGVSSGVGLNTLIRDTGNARTAQLIIDAAQLSTIPTGSQITSITYRLYSGATTAYPATDATWASYDISMGQSVPPASATATFATNVVGALVPVRSGPLTIPAASFGVSSTPRPWGYEIIFSSPYVYNGGPLLIEIRHTGSNIVNTATDFLDAVAIGSSPNRSFTAVGNTATTGAEATFTINRLNYIPGGVTGACCITATGNCITTNAAGCTTAGGVYQGNGSSCGSIQCPQPPTGACCVNTGTGCVIATQFDCTNLSGVYQGNNTTCASAGCRPVCEITGSLPAGPATWPVTHGTQNTRLFRDGVPDTCALSASGGAPLAGSFAYDQYDFINAGPAACIDFVINTACTGTNFVYVGAYVGGYNPNDPLTNNIASIGGSPNPTAVMSFNVPANTAYSIVVAEVTAGAGCPSYTFNLAGGSSNCLPTPSGCYANCDNSTVAPCLNVNDFVCFNNAYSANAAYANCDASTSPPVLNVNDFICFNNKFASSCSNPCAPH